MSSGYRIRRLLLLSVLVVVLLGCSQDAPTESVEGTVETVGPGELVVDAPAPPFALTTSSGERLSLEALRGQMVVVNFWATWCAPCRLEMPELQAVYEQHQSAGLEMIGVEVASSGSPAESRAFLEEVGVAFPTTRDVDGKMENAYLLRSALPTTVLIDRTGNVAYVHLGPLTDTVLTEKLMELGL